MTLLTRRRIVIYSRQNTKQPLRDHHFKIFHIKYTTRHLVLVLFLSPIKPNVNGK